RPRTACSVPSRDWASPRTKPSITTKSSGEVGSSSPSGQAVAWTRHGPPCSDSAPMTSIPSRAAANAPWRVHRHVATEAGEVEVRKEVITERQTIDVPVEREEVVVKQHSTSATRADGGPIGDEEEIRIPVKEEHARVDKETVSRGEVSAEKRTVQDTERVSEDNPRSLIMSRSSRTLTSPRLSTLARSFSFARGAGLFQVMARSYDERGMFAVLALVSRVLGVGCHRLSFGEP